MLSWRLPGDPKAGGAETLTFEILRRAVERGHDITWFAASSPGTAETEVVDGIRFVRRGRQWTVHFRAWLWLRRRLGEFDVVVDQINTLPFLTPLYVPQNNRRMMIHQTAREYWWRETRGLFRLAAPFGYFAEPRYLKAYRATNTITVSDSTRSELLDIGLPPQLVSIIPEAIATEPASTLSPKSQQFRLIVIGRLTPAKFVEEAVDAFILVKDAIPDTVLDVVGAGDDRYRANLEQKITNRGLSDAVRFHGRVSEERKSELLASAHVHVFASHREGWGLTVTEAAALGTPTVGYDAPGVRDSVRDERLLAGLESGPEGLAARILALAGDPAAYAEIRDEAWRFACSLSYESTTDAFLGALRA